MMQNVDALGATASDVIAGEIRQPVDGHVPIISSFIIGLVISALSTNIWDCGASFWLVITSLVAYCLWIGALVEGGVEYLSPGILPLSVLTRRKSFVFTSFVLTILGIVTFSTWERKDNKDEDKEDMSCGAYVSRLLLLIFSIISLIFSLVLMSGKLGDLLRVVGIADINVPSQLPTQFSFLTRSG